MCFLALIWATLNLTWKCWVGCSQKQGVSGLAGPNHESTEGAPGLLGVNAIGRCYQELFNDLGLNLFHCPPVQAAKIGWRQALSERLCGSGYIAKAVIQPGHALRVHAGCLKFVPATCSIFGSITSCFLEPLPYGEGVTSKQSSDLYGPVASYSRQSEHSSR